ncbi:Outer envelope pore protein 16-1, chloroplastic [Linum perenne]
MQGIRYLFKLAVSEVARSPKPATPATSSFLAREAENEISSSPIFQATEKIESEAVSSVNLSTEKKKKMPSTSFAGSVSTPTVGVAIDTGNPVLDLTADGFLKTAGVAAIRVLADDTFHAAKRGSLSGNDIEKSLKKMCKEGAYWGAVGGVYVGLEYGMQRIRGTSDWKNAMLGGMATGALMSAATTKNTDKVISDAIAGGAIATAAKFLNYLI